MIALCCMIVDDVQNDFDIGIMHLLHKGLEITIATSYSVSNALWILQKPRKSSGASLYNRRQPLLQRRKRDGFV